MIPRWDDFQHRDMARSTIPPWIKNYTRLLSDDDYLALSLAQRGLLHGLWILYASHRRDLNETSTRRFLVSNKAEAKHFTKNLEALNHAGFIRFSASRPASNVASDLASLEVEREEEKNQGLFLPRPDERPFDDTEPDPDEQPLDLEPIGNLIAQSLREAAA